MSTIAKRIQFNLDCDQVGFLDPPPDTHYAYETISCMWEGLLTGNTDVFTTFICLARFFSVASKAEIARFCTTYNLTELWFFFRHTDQLALQTLALVCLNVAFQHQNKELKNILYQQINVDIIFDLLSSPYEDIANEAMGLVAAMCAANNDILEHYLSKEIIEKLHDLPVLFYYGNLLTTVTVGASLEQVPILVECIQKCAVCDTVDNVKSAFTASSLLIKKTENNGEIMESVNEICASALDNLIRMHEQNKSDSSSDASVSESLAACCSLLNLYGEEAFIELSARFFHIIQSMSESDFESFERCYGPIIGAFIANSSTWIEAVGAEVFFETILSFHDALNYENRAQTCRVLLKAFPYTRVFSVRVVQVFVDFMCETVDAVPCINALREIVEAFHDNKELSELLVKIDANLNEIFTLTCSDEIMEVAEELSNAIESNK